MNVILIKYSEIGLKGKNRKDFENKLAQNIVIATGVCERQVVRLRGRILVKDVEDADIPRVSRSLENVFGVHAYAFAYCVSHDSEEIKSVACASVQKYINEDIKTFAVNARRDKAFCDRTSVEINTEVGKRISDEFDNLSVHLKAPDITVYIEVREKETFIYTSKDETKGLGGLPVGVSGRALGLLSGGMDSPVAMTLGMKRGLQMSCVYFHSAPYTSAHAQEKVFDIARVLARYNKGEVIVFVPAFGEIQTYIKEHAPAEYMTILFRRSMARISERIAEAHMYTALLTGDNLAQVASQTLENMSVIDASVDMLMLRPVVGYDKQEIMNMAERIGTYTISARPFQDCCTVFTPRAPKTKSRLKDIDRIEAQCNKLEHLERVAFEGVDTYRVTPHAIEHV